MRGMRADRLVAILLMLQAKGRITAAEVAEELEMSERTARRDLDALGMAGLPVYSTQGRNGGWQLAGGGRTDLSGLSAAEARALFLVAGPSSSATPELRAALRKLVRALPEPFRDEAEAAWTAVVVDQRSWDGPARTRPAPPLLDAAQTAVVEGFQVHLDYVARDGTREHAGGAPAGRGGEGIGLVPRGRHRGRTADVSRRPHPIDHRHDRQGRAARRISTSTTRGSSSPTRSISCARPYAFGHPSIPDFVGLCRMIFGKPASHWPRRPTMAGSTSRCEVTARRPMAGEIAGLGRGVEVLDPPEVRATSWRGWVPSSSRSTDPT